MGSFLFYFVGMLALTDHVIPGDVYAWTAVIVLPVNSAVNPFLYTLAAFFTKKVGRWTFRLRASSSKYKIEYMYRTCNIGN